MKAGICFQTSIDVTSIGSFTLSTSVKILTSKLFSILPQMAPPNRPQHAILAHACTQPHCHSVSLSVYLRLCCSTCHPGLVSKQSWSSLFLPCHTCVSSKSLHFFHYYISLPTSVFVFSLTSFYSRSHSPSLPLCSTFRSPTASLRNVYLSSCVSVLQSLSLPSIPRPCFTPIFASSHYCSSCVLSVSVHSFISIVFTFSSFFFFPAHILHRLGLI